MSEQFTRIIAVATMLHLKILLLSLALCVAPAQPIPEHGRILFFAPWISKSIKFKIMPLVEGLADQGHEVVLAMPFCQDCEKHENVTVVHVKEYDGK